MRQDRESECVRAFDTSVESLCHRLDFNVVTNASNDLLHSENQTYTWDCLQPSAPPLQRGTEIIKFKLQGLGASNTVVTVSPLAKQYLNAHEFN